MSKGRIQVIRRMCGTAVYTSWPLSSIRILCDGNVPGKNTRMWTFYVKVKVNFVLNVQYIVENALLICNSVTQDQWSLSLKKAKSKKMTDSLGTKCGIYHCCYKVVNMLTLIGTRYSYLIKGQRGGQFDPATIFSCFGTFSFSKLKTIVKSFDRWRKKTDITIFS